MIEVLIITYRPSGHRGTGLCDAVGPPQPLYNHNLHTNVTKQKLRLFLTRLPAENHRFHVQSHGRMRNGMVRSAPSEKSNNSRWDIVVILNLNCRNVRVGHLVNVLQQLLGSA